MRRMRRIGKELSEVDVGSLASVRAQSTQYPTVDDAALAVDVHHAAPRARPTDVEHDINFAVVTYVNVGAQVNCGTMIIVAISMSR
jgi:hypothetical protein